MRFINLIGFPCSSGLFGDSRNTRHLDLFAAGKVTQNGRQVSP